MTDREMKKFFDNLLRDEHDLDDTEIAIALLAAVAMAKDASPCNGSTKGSAHDWISAR